MCTAITYHAGGHYFGRNLDLNGHQGERVTVTPRNYPFPFRKLPALPRHYAILGMAQVAEGYPLYYDAVNERGLAMAGLYFPDNTVYRESAPDKDNVAPFELIPWLLGQCADLGEVRQKLEKLNLWNCPFSEALPLTPLHWLIADRAGSLTLEATAAGLQIYDNPVGVLTNNPPFDFMLAHLACFRNLTAAPVPNRWPVALPEFCQGLGAVGLPGDHSSPSRFIRAAFVKENSLCGPGDSELAQFFHILGSVEMPRGCVRLTEGGCDFTVYTACCDQDRAAYHYTTYDDPTIRTTELHHQDLEATQLTAYPPKL